MSIPHSSLMPNIEGAVLLYARDLLRKHGFSAPVATKIFEATGASKTRTYALLAALPEAMGALVKSPGRPAKDTSNARVSRR